MIDQEQQGSSAGRHPDAASHMDPAHYAMTKLSWRIAQTSLLECVVDIHTRRKLIRTMPPNRDRPINRAMVVGCAVSATRNHLKLHEPRKLKVLFSNIHAKTRKLWKHPAMRLAASRTNAAHQSTNRPLTSSVCPPRCPLHSSGLTCRRTSRRAGVPPIIETAANIRSP